MNDNTGFLMVVHEIRNQTARLEKIERMVNMDPHKFNEGYEKYQNLQNHIEGE